jgi:hypothetical protein
MQAAREPRWEYLAEPAPSLTAMTAVDPRRPKNGIATTTLSWLGVPSFR